jgi:hypothetical protein
MWPGMPLSSTSLTFESWYSDAMTTSEILTAMDAQIARLQQAETRERKGESK